MVLAAPGPLLTPPPSSSPPKTPFRSYSAIHRRSGQAGLASEIVMQSTSGASIRGEPALPRRFVLMQLHASEEPENKLQHSRAIVIANITMFFAQGPRCSTLAVINPSTASRNLLSATNPSWEPFVPTKRWMLPRGRSCSLLARTTRTATCRRANTTKTLRFHNHHSIHVLWPFC